MLTLEPTDTRPTTARSRSPRAIVAIAAVVVVAAGAAIGIWALTRDGGPVAAEDAQIELTFTGEDASYVGDREILAGLADVVFSNESDLPAYMVVQWFAPGSALLDEELANAPEGGDFFPGGKTPLGEAVIMQEFAPGTATESIELQPGTYLVEAGTALEPDPTHIWRAAVIDVVAD